MTYRHNIILPKLAAPKSKVEKVDSWDHDDRSCGSGLNFLVTTEHSKSRKMAIETIARYFQREFGYDFPGFTSCETRDWVKIVGWTVICWDKTRFAEYVVGSLCFRWKSWADHDPGWSLTWAWIHPYERRKGRLFRAWSFLRKEFGDFHIERPLSYSMQAFLDKAEGSGSMAKKT